MRPPAVDDALDVVKLAARRAVEAGAHPAAVAWDAVTAALGAQEQRDPISPPTPEARRVATRAAEAVRRAAP